MRNTLKELIEPSGKMFREKYVFEHYQEIYLVIKKYAIENELNDLQFKQQVYHYLNDIKEKRFCKNPNCNNEVKFRNSTIGYQEYCCNKCIGSDPEIMKQKEVKSLAKFGTKTPAESDEIKQKMIKTNQEKYGSNCPLQNDEINKKSKETLMKNYGVLTPYQSKIIMDKMKINKIQNSIN